MCSFICLKKFQTECFNGKNNNNYRGGILLIICKQCNKKCYSYNKTRKYCSSKCYNNSDKKRLTSIKSNIKRKKPCTKCKICSTKIYYARVYCKSYWPKKIEKYIGSCKNCTSFTGHTRDVQYCKTCRKTNAHRKEIYSTCSKCGNKIKGKRNRKYCDICLQNWRSDVRGMPKKVDANQKEIVFGLRAIGCSVIDCSAVGHGFPDLIIGLNGKNFLIEVKNPQTRGKLNDLQKAFFKNWNGQVNVIWTLEEAIDIVTISFTNLPPL